MAMFQLKLSFWPGRKSRDVFDVLKDLGDDLFKFSTDAIGQKAVIADDTKVGGQDVHNEFEDKLFSGKTTVRFRFSSRLVEEGHELTVVGSDSGLSEGRFFGITADILAGESHIQDV